MGTVFSKLLIIVALTRSTNGDCRAKYPTDRLPNEDQCSISDPADPHRTNKCLEPGLDPLRLISGYQSKTDTEKAEDLRKMIECEIYIDENKQPWVNYLEWRQWQLTDYYFGWDKILDDEQTMEIKCCLDQDLRKLEGEWEEYKTFHPDEIEKRRLKWMKEYQEAHWDTDPYDPDSEEVPQRKVCDDEGGFFSRLFSGKFDCGGEKNS